MEFLQLIFEKYPMNWMFDLYKKYANEEDIVFLQNKLEAVDSKLKKEITKLIEAIRKRKKIYKFP
ncbi:hypothetical protein EGT74_15395 [Chitinophaga lutea]|uniref:Uncharacterized protein n=1 Tax=Chitinophaga lutea TaxID=2488634 RepID=A0A3N4PIA8_9BACT|nr:hypothetical protein EGT74_15395 [Chitinophaga lutea]